MLRVTLSVAGKEGCNRDGRMYVSECLVFVPHPPPTFSLSVHHTTNQTGFVFHSKERVLVTPDFGGKSGGSFFAGH